MITLYTWGTPNGRKVSIMLEECGLPYAVRPIDITQGAQFDPAFVAINPNSKIPAIVDDDGPMTVFESGAILVYLAEKTGCFLPPAGPQRYAVLQWLMFQMGGIGPIFGQTHHFLRFAPEKVPYAIDRYSKETRRLYGVLDKHLGDAEHLAGDYSIADMATFPWIARHEWQGVDLGDFTNVRRWFDAVGSRSAVKRGMEVPAS
ncbi:MAG: GSH-dependent disulfide-bond oxidoreductase [Pseudomonadota bacterium]|nr:GSH-dependent disulfide-bond oxidoreductase [Pseudomonadota bacterium]MDQ5914755.1 GSH-dependent disulfide-bond oxidoreductase [Pseudomonadota bacterium]MDQ5946118.1 GSH-dependent disulfide-bond oxidoreductase [Pseudomonadota bacterium]MDQ5959143.1 GSH-dependent disulfide-bond oxidoreductase [Pseudomonadota bacterium]